MKKDIILAQDISKSFGDKRILNNISLNIKQGEVIAIVGPSGAGKTTLLQILSTLDKPSNPKNSVLTINDASPLDLKDKELAKFRNEHIGFVFQFHQLLPEFTALENVCIPAFISNQKPKVVEPRAKELLNYLGLSDKYDNKPSQLSGGEQQRVAVARALINDPAIVFADEPSGNLDTEGAENLHQLFFDLRDKFNQTFVIVTHNETLANMADRKIVLKDGEIVNQ